MENLAETSLFAGNDWLAGFTDGEGSFGIYESYPKNPGLIPRFSIQLRADDLEILECLRTEFGGTIRVFDDTSTSMPKASWRVLDKRGLMKLVSYFDSHPLRAKKAKDYAIWRRAVLAYASEGFRAPALPALRNALVAGRVYVASTESGTIQPRLRLVTEGER